ncbi:hypothetical protein [Streptomyces sp. NPDC002490]|uniref:hypothetical protein n=1 Tax=Streptomyces sp. NPDC002490 TaxID=3154416 RepID=UPI00331F84F3
MSFGQGGPAHGPGGPQGPWDGAHQGQHGQHGQHQGLANAPGTPDWAAMADASATDNRRKRLLVVLGAALATVAVGAAVAVAIVTTGEDSPAAAPSATAPSGYASESGGPAPSFAATTPPPPPNPKDFVSSAAKDKAPISAESLFPGPEVTLGGTVYRRGATGSTTACAGVTRGDLGEVLTRNGCTRLMRATYGKDGIAVTVGVALFDTEAQATRAKDQTDKGNLLSLSGAGVSGFCNTTVCRTTANSYGRYAYFTVAGHTSGKNVTPQDRPVYRTGDDLAEFAFRQIIRRGEAQAAAAAEQPL